MKIHNHTLIKIEQSDIINGSCTIPIGITSIGNAAFFRCEGLKNITLPESLTSIGHSAFWGCENLKSITIPERVSHIGSHTFRWCQSLESITLPDGLTSIDDCAFYGCENLKSITIPERVAHIGGHAFKWCQSLESITLPDGLTNISDGTFEWCENLKTITLSNGLTSIDDYAFYGCENLESITLPDNITRIGKCVFDFCRKLTQIQWGEIIYQVRYMDGLCMYILQTKELGAYTIYKCRYFPKMDKIVWVSEKDGITAHGTSIRDSIRNVDFKLLEKQDISECIARIKSQGYVTPLDYRMITRVCRKGMEGFIKRNHLTWDDKHSIVEAIKLTEGEYGHETFIKALEEYGCI